MIKRQGRNRAGSGAVRGVRDRIKGRSRCVGRGSGRDRDNGKGMRNVSSRGRGKG